MAVLARPVAAGPYRPTTLNFAPVAGLRGGGGGIRTHEGLASLPVFKTGAFNRSATPPALFIKHLRRSRHNAGRLSAHIVPTFFEFSKRNKVIRDDLGQFIGHRVARAIAEPVGIYAQSDRRVGVAEMVLQVSERDSALDQDRCAAMAQAVEGDRAQLRARARAG